MNKLNQWCHAHPFKAIVFTVFFTGIATFIGCNDHLFSWGLIAFMAFLVFWVLEFCVDSKKLPIILAFVLAGSVDAAQPEATPVGIGVGVVVVCGGGYCVYKLVKFCQKKFPKSTNSPAFMPQDGDEQAASWNYGSMGSCDPTLTPGGDLRFVDSAVGTLFTIDLAVGESGGVTMRTSARVGDDATQNWTDFQNEIARHGVLVTGSPDGSQYYATNGVPCAPEDIPISFDPLTGTVELKDGSGPVKLLEIMRSRDLISWHPYLRTKVGAGGRGLRIEDATTASSMFYKVSVSDVP